MQGNNIATEEDMHALAAKLAAAIPKEGAIIYLYGSLGAGKTTFARGFLRRLGYTEKVKSPTYTLVEPYDVGNRKIYHFDLYRLKDPTELEAIGIQDYMMPGAICLIEWPEKGAPCLPPADITCSITFSGAGRVVQLEALSRKGEEILIQC